MSDKKERTEFVAEAIARWILSMEQGNAGSSLKVFDGSHEELSSGHIVSWEEGHEDWVYHLSDPNSTPYQMARFMGCWLEVVNHFTLAVYEGEL